jgi:3-mercaptopyruvate sulfurtransferase SseA
LAEIGYKDVRDYEGGKSDWMEAGLPIEGDEAGSQQGSVDASTNPQKDVRKLAY